MSCPLVKTLYQIFYLKFQVTLTQHLGPLVQGSFVTQTQPLNEEIQSCMETKVYHQANGPIMNNKMNRNLSLMLSVWLPEKGIF